MKRNENQSFGHKNMDFNGMKSMKFVPPINNRVCFVPQSSLGAIGCKISAPSKGATLCVKVLRVLRS